jgi:hypothetical protein
MIEYLYSWHELRTFNVIPLKLWSRATNEQRRAWSDQGAQVRA